MTREKLSIKVGTTIPHQLKFNKNDYDLLLTTIEYSKNKAVEISGSSTIANILSDAYALILNKIKYRIENE